MSITYIPQMMVGWEIMSGEEPDFWHDAEGGMMDEDWSCVDGMAERLGFYGYELVTQVNHVTEDEGWVVGIPIDTEPAPTEEFASRLEGLEPLAVKVWRKVMRCEPTTRPNVISFTEVL